MRLRKPVVLDTDIASLLWRGKLEPEHRQKLTGQTPLLTFVTIAEFLRGAYKANWDQQQMARLTAFYEQFELIRCDFDVVKTWVDSQDLLYRRASPCQPMTVGSQPVASVMTIRC